MSQARRASLDEDDVRIRAGRGSRPRTRRRPAHEQAAHAFVAGVDRGRYRCVLGDRIVTAMKARELGRGNIVVGDTVSLAGDVSGAPGTLARVVRVEPRHSVLRRSADDTDPVERVIVANADQMLIVTSLADPAPRLRLIDRFLVAAYDAEIEPVLCLTKSDLASPDEILPVYAPLGLRFIVLGRPLRDAELAELRELLAGKISVLVGQSGVGKSTLVNLLIPDAARAVGTVSPVTGRGRHTSSSVVALPLPDLGISDAGISEIEISDVGISDSGISAGGWIIDTPGLRSFGLGHMSPADVLAAFPDLVDVTAGCPPGCDHLGLTALSMPLSARAARLPPGSTRCVGCSEAWKVPRVPTPTTSFRRTGMAVRPLPANNASRATAALARCCCADSSVGTSLLLAARGRTRGRLPADRS